MGERTRTVGRQVGLSLVTAGGALTGFGCAGDNIAAPTTGSIEITTSTTGSSLDPDGYALTVDAVSAQSIGPNATLTVPELDAGSHSVTISGIAPNCLVMGDNPRGVVVTAGAVSAVEFGIACQVLTVQRWTPMLSGTDMLLSRVWGSSASNVFAVGEQTTETIILHYDGSAWATQLRRPGILRGGWATSATDAYAVGNDWPSYLDLYLHYDGRQWSSTVSPTNDPPPLEGPSLNAVWGSSGSEVFAVGVWNTDEGVWRAFVAHYNGTVWSEMPVSTGAYVELTDVWGNGATDVYAVGSFAPHDSDPSEDRAVIIHYDGRAWSEVLREPNLVLRSIWGSSARDMYAAGTMFGAGGLRAAALRHFGGGDWSSVPGPASSSLRGIWGSAPNDIYLLAESGGSSVVVWHYDGAGWTQTNAPEGPWADVWGSGPGDVFVVGAGGTILHGGP